VTQFYQRRKLVSRRELPQADMTIEGEPSAAREEEILKNDDVEDETYVPSPELLSMVEGRVLLVQVQVGQQGMRRLSKKMKKVMVMGMT
jgi:hypothetical protein